MPPKKSRILKFLISIVLIGLFTILLINRQLIIDQINIWQFKPSNEINYISDSISLTPRGKFVFYSGTPSIESTQKFNEVCGDTEKSTAILGCYSRQRIYIYDINDKRLDGIKQVTAAHEMLHAAYDRLSAIEKNKINILLNSEYEKLKNDKRFSSRMALYAKTEPGQRDNELHSIIATESLDINSELETYYSLYFKDRHKIVDLYKNYSTVFIELENRAEQLSLELAQLRSDIDKKTEDYDLEIESLNKDITEFNHGVSNGRYQSLGSYEYERSLLVNRSAIIESMRLVLLADIAKYEGKRKELESISLQSDSLMRSIDSNLAPAPSL